MLEGWRERAAALKRDVAAVAIAARDPRTGWMARLVILAIVAYALSPIDLIPDFIPVLGYLDEILLLPGALLLAMRLIPPDVMEEARGRAGSLSLKASIGGAAAVIAIWIALAAGGIWAAVRLLRHW